MLFTLSSAAGAVLFAIPIIRRLIIANIRTAFPEKDRAEVRRLARENCSNIVLTVLEFLWFSGKSREIRDLVDFPEECWNLTCRAREAGRGLIWVTPHLGNWELAGFKFKQYSEIPFAVVYRPINNPYIDRLIMRSRMSEGNMVIPDKGAVKGMIKALKSGCFIATLIDQNTRARDGGVFADLFGLPVSTSRAPAMFARKFNVAVAVGGCIRKGRRYSMYTRELPKKPSEYASDEELIQDLVGINESLIREYPEQYLWLYKRWLYIPREASEELKSKYPFYSKVAPPKFYDKKAENKQERKA